MAMPEVAFCGKSVSGAELQLICSVVKRYASLSRMELAHTVCELLHWARPSGGLKARECRELLERLDAEGMVRLPPKRATKPVGSTTAVPMSARGEPAAALQGKVGAFEPIVLDLVQSTEQRLLFRELVGRYHYLGHAVPFGAQLRYLFYSGQQVLGAMQFSSPAWRMAVREGWVGWDEAARRGNLQRVINQSRFLILPWVQIANLASVMLSRALRRVGGDWQARYGLVPLLVETLVDESRYSGHCYRAANWIRLGETRGRGRMDREHRREGLAPKAVWVYALVADAAPRLRGEA
jgi:Druantia protein DruA